jgi:hypothetical protein
MEPMELLSSKIENFPGYATDDARKLSDEEVRSYLGEALADLEVRLGAASEAPIARIGDLLLRVGFTNQAAYKIYEEEARNRSVGFDEVASADARVVALADRATSIDAAASPGYLEEVSDALNCRDAAMSAPAPAAS